MNRRGWIVMLHSVPCVRFCVVSMTMVLVGCGGGETESPAAKVNE